MLARYGKINVLRLATETGIGLGTAARLKDAESSIGIDKVEQLANAMGLPLWQLLDPSVDPSHPPAPMSPQALELARKLDAISEPEARARTYAAISYVLDIAHKPADPEPPPPLPSSSPEPQQHT